jgi:hypothetical protein
MILRTATSISRWSIPPTVRSCGLGSCHRRRLHRRFNAAATDIPPPFDRSLGASARFHVSDDIIKRLGQKRTLSIQQPRKVALRQPGVIRQSDVTSGPMAEQSKLSQRRGSIGPSTMAKVTLSPIRSGCCRLIRPYIRTRMSLRTTRELAVGKPR